MSFCSKVFNPNEQFVQRIRATGRFGASDDDAGSPAISGGWSMLMRQLMPEEVGAARSKRWYKQAHFVTAIAGTSTTEFRMPQSLPTLGGNTDG
jgi:hypothetical protein